jgi:hypothetical protein
MSLGPWGKKKEERENPTISQRLRQAKPGVVSASDLAKLDWDDSAPLVEFTSPCEGCTCEPGESCKRETD